MTLRHYSTALHLPWILASDALLPSRADAHGRDHRGVLWFSTNPDHERSANKRGARNGEGVPRVRFATEHAQAMPWRAVARRAGYSHAVAARLEAAGRRMGAAPSEWWARLLPLPLSLVAAIEWNDSGVWQPLDLARLHAEVIGPGAMRMHMSATHFYDVVRTRWADGEWAYATRAAQLPRLDPRLAAEVA
jgi:hypothetical protein